MPALLLTLLFIGIGWYLIIRPQQQRIRTQQALVAELAVGDRVVTAGGIHGILVAVEDETVRIEVAPGTILTLARPAVARRLDPRPDVEDTTDAEHEPATPTTTDTSVAQTEPTNDGSTL